MPSWLKLLLLPWVLPMTLVMWPFFILPLLLFRQIRHDGPVEFMVWSFSIVKGTWYDRRREGWAGFSGPMFMVIRRGGRASRLLNLIRHEARHCNQWLVFGPLFPAVYLALLPFYGYREHPLEKDARRAEN